MENMILTRFYLIGGDGEFGKKFPLVDTQSSVSYWENRGYDCIPIYIKEEDRLIYENITKEVVE